MDKRRVEKIDGLTALGKISESITIYDGEGFGYFYDPNGIFYRRHNKKFMTEPVDMLIAEIASKEWYVKKPFDVRVEMLARPDEWVGAFEEIKYGEKEWQKVKFDTQSMRVLGSHLTSDDADDDVYYLSESDFSKCVPIEDVPMVAWAI